MFHQWVRASTPAGVAPEPLGGSGGTIWGVFVSGRVCVFLVEMELFNQGVVVQPRWLVVFRDRGRQSSWILASMRTVGSGEAVSFLGIGRDRACGPWRRCAPWDRASQSHGSWWGEFGVADLGVLVCSRSVAGWGEFGVTDLGSFGVQSKRSQMGRVWDRRPRRFVS